MKRCKACIKDGLAGKLLCDLLKSLCSSDCALLTRLSRSGTNSLAMSLLTVQTAPDQLGRLSALQQFLDVLRTMSLFLL